MGSPSKWDLRLERVERGGLSCFISFVSRRGADFCVVEGANRLIYSIESQYSVNVREEFARRCHFPFRFRSRFREVSVISVFLAGESTTGCFKSQIQSFPSS